MGWIKTEITVEEQPYLRYNAPGLAICTIFVDGIKYVAFGQVAEDMNEWITVRDTICVRGYYKLYGAGEDFIVRKWERMA